MRITIGKELKKNVKPEYINEININFKYNNRDVDLNKKYKEILQNIQNLNRDNSVKINISSTNSLSAKDIEIDYALELKPYQYPSKELNDFYAKFNSFLIDFKKNSETKKETFDDNSYIKAFYYQIGKACGHKGSVENIRNMGEGVFNRYCLGDDYTNKANDYEKMKVLCDDLKSYKDDKNEDTFNELVKSSTDFKEEPIVVDDAPNKYLEDIVSFFDNEKQNKTKDEVPDENKSTSRATLSLKKNR